MNNTDSTADQSQDRTAAADQSHDRTTAADQSQDSNYMTSPYYYSWDMLTLQVNVTLDFHIEYLFKQSTFYLCSFLLSDTTHLYVRN